MRMVVSVFIPEVRQARDYPNGIRAAMTELVRKWLTKDAEKMNQEMVRVLREAVKSGELRQVRAMIDEFPELLRETTPFGTWLHIAAKGGNLNARKSQT